MKRKSSSHPACPRKKAHPLHQSSTATPASIEQPVLLTFYPRLLTLRHYLLSALPRSSRNRRRRIAHLGHPIANNKLASPVPDLDLGRLLDSTLIGERDSTRTHSAEQLTKECIQDIQSFTQQLSPAITTGGTCEPGYFKQAEIVDFVIWRLFKRASSHKLRHLLCHGFERSASAYRRNDADGGVTSSIPGLFSRHPNSFVHALKGPLWCRLHAVLGEGGDRIIMDMLTDCAIFCPVDQNPTNYYQISGPPMFDLDPIPAPTAPMAQTRPPANSCLESRTPTDITFVRSRMFYAKPALNARGAVRFGLRHIHVLNRFPRRDDMQQTVQILRYIFPRQYGLHNVFTSKTDRRETAMPFQDYTLREKEIHQCMRKALGSKINDAAQVTRWKLRVPKRLRGDLVSLIIKMRIRNQRCSYTELLRHYCPTELPLPSKTACKRPLAATRHATAAAKTNPDHSTDACFTDMACPTSHVSAFCRAVVAKVIPKPLWGDDHNKHTIMHYIDQFVSLRKFETLTLHEVTQKLRITALLWLQLPGQHGSTTLARPDFDKRKDILHEFVYWVFDSFLIPLIRSNFYVTESNAHRNRLFYFRHDVWRFLTEPPLATLKLNMFEEMQTERVNRLLAARPLGFSKMRLLPKKQGVRVIMNLKRRQQVTRYGAVVLGRSINSVMTPVFNAITYEKAVQPEKLGSSLFSVGDMFPKLEAFKNSLRARGLQDKQLYFAKVDVVSCFDTIPQRRLLSMVDSLMSAQTYQSGKHVEISHVGALQRLHGQHADPAPLKRWVSHTAAARDAESFGQLVQNKLAGTKSNTIFVNTHLQQEEAKADLMHLLREHVERNLVKIGKRFYRQKTGIPQGSILSSLLCNYFYAELERHVLGFALGSDCLLLRLLDDFLLITIDPQHAERFVRVMHRGHAEYGVQVRSAKSMTNFDALTEDGVRVPKITPGTHFLYCGVCIDTTTLEVRKNAERATRADVENSLTIELSKVPGQTFHRKALNAFKIQLKAMFIDTGLNSVSTILANLHQSFHEAAVRCLEYVRALARVRTTCTSLLIRTVDSIIGLAFVMVQRRARSRSEARAVHVHGVNVGVGVGVGVISRRQVQWLACKAFFAVFQRAQTGHAALLAWLQRELAAARVSDAKAREMLEAAAA